MTKDEVYQAVMFYLTMFSVVKVFSVEVGSIKYERAALLEWHGAE